MQRSVISPSPGLGLGLNTLLVRLALALGSVHAFLTWLSSLRLVATTTKVSGLSGTAVALLLLVAAFAGQGFALDPTRPFSGYLRTRFTTEDGLPSSVVHEIVQSQDGFLWLSVGGENLPVLTASISRASLLPLRML